MLEYGPDEEFRYGDLPEQLQDRFDKLRDIRIIVHANKERGSNWTWRVNPTARACLERHEHQPSGPLTPCCGYTGFENLRDGDYECVICGDEFDRDEFVMAD